MFCLFVIFIIQKANRLHTKRENYRYGKQKKRNNNNIYTQIQVHKESIHVCISKKLSNNWCNWRVKESTAFLLQLFDVPILIYCCFPHLSFFLHFLMFCFYFRVHWCFTKCRILTSVESGKGQSKKKRKEKTQRRRRRN